MAHFQKIDPDLTPEYAGDIAADKVISGNPAETVSNQFTNAAGNMFTGIWSSTAGKWHVSYSEDEFFHILEGEAILSEKGGESVHLKAGDHYTISAGFDGTWETLGSVKKLYVIYEEPSK